MNYKKRLLTASIISTLFMFSQANDYISIISQEKNVYDVVENSISVATNWIDVGSEFNCIKKFSEYDYPLGEEFTQNENCLQKQERTITTTETFNGTQRTTVKTDTQNVPVIISYLEIGKENFNTGVQRTQYSSWVNEGSHYNCEDFTPLVSTVRLGESFTQNRNCSQDQNRTETVYEIWADNSETIKYTNIEVQTLIEAQTQNSTGTLVLNSCLALLNSGETLSGDYTINLTESENINVYCDMTTDGGGWTLLMSQKLNYWFTESNNLNFNTSNPDSNSNLYSILGKVDDIKTNNQYMYKNYKTATTYDHTIFKQDASVIANNGNTSVVTPAGFQMLSTTEPGIQSLNGFGLVQHHYGHAKYGSQTDSWWWSLGQFKMYRSDSCPIVTNPYTYNGSQQCTAYQYSFWVR